MRVFFDMSCDLELRLAVLGNQQTPDEGLWVESSAASADVVIFGSDDISYINNSEIYRSYKVKCICISESDIPTFRIPGLYAANLHSFFTASRSATTSYFISQRWRGNPEVQRLIGTAAEKRYMYSFMGGSNSWPRKRLFRSLPSGGDVFIKPTDAYNHWQVHPDEAQARSLRMREYAEVMAASKFALCPRGCGLSSYRLFESMSLGVAPVIISDRWLPVAGVDWSFALSVKERDISRIDLIVRSHAAEWQQRGEIAQETYHRFFSDDAVPSQLHASAKELVEKYKAGREAVMAPVTEMRANGREVYWAIYRALKYLILLGYSTARIPFPVQLNRPVEVQLGLKKSDSTRNNPSKR
nr:exostosin family protein [uncultured Lichenicoccus sp.]